ALKGRGFSRAEGVFSIESRGISPSGPLTRLRARAQPSTTPPKPAKPPSPSHSKTNLNKRRPADPSRPAQRLFPAVILRKWSRPRSGRLPTKDLCTLPWLTRRSGELPGRARSSAVPPRAASDAGFSPRGIAIPNRCSPDRLVYWRFSQLIPCYSRNYLGHGSVHKDPLPLFVLWRTFPPSPMIIGVSSGRLLNPARLSWPWVRSEKNFANSASSA